MKKKKKVQPPQKETQTLKTKRDIYPLTLQKNSPSQPKPEKFTSLPQNPPKIPNQKFKQKHLEIIFKPFKNRENSFSKNSSLSQNTKYQKEKEVKPTITTKTTTYITNNEVKPTAMITSIPINRSDLL